MPIEYILPVDFWLLLNLPYILKLIVPELLAEYGYLRNT
jgi:hypothetical protein